MARPELGIKRACPTTGRKFYDLNRDPIVSPYTGEVLPRSVLQPTAARGGAARARPAEDEDEPEVVPAGAEIVSLDEVEAGEEAKAAVDGDEDAVVEEEEDVADVFLEEEEEAGDDVTGLIDGEIEDEEET